MLAGDLKFLDPDECVPFLNLRVTDPPEYREIKESIRVLGILQNVNARPHPSKPGIYEVFAGRLRLRAAKELKAEGLPIKIPALVSDASDLEVFRVTLTENVDRAGVSPYAIGNWLQLMQMNFSLSQAALAREVNKSQGWVGRHLQLFEEVRKQSESAGVDVKKLESLPPTERHARVLRSLDPEMQQKIFSQAAATGEFPSARDIERRSSASVTPEEILGRYRPSTTDDEFMEYLLQEEAGLALTEARKRVRTWRWGKRRTGIPKVSPRDPTVKLYERLSQFFPYEVIDIVSGLVPAKTFETMVKYCRRYVARLFSKASEELRQAVLEEWI